MAGGRILADATGIMPNFRVSIARKDAAERVPHVLQVVMHAVAETAADIAAHRPGVAAELVPMIGVPATMPRRLRAGGLTTEGRFGERDSLA